MMAAASSVFLLARHQAVRLRPCGPVGFAPLAIGLCLTLIHLVSIPVTNTSVNPARSTGPALVVGGAALTQLWLFWIAPLVGGILGGVIYRWLSDEPRGQVTGTPA
jgi:aquaporin Z